MISSFDIHWAAGFLEGEGGFVSTLKNGAFTISAVQLQREPLERLHRFFGGHLKAYVNVRGTLVHRWTVNGSHAVSVAFTIYDLMSPRRKVQIQTMVAGWKLCPGRNNRWKTHCPRGHEYLPENIYWTTHKSGRKSRSCKRCYKTYYGKEAERKEFLQ